jgi:hypothetical protein
MDYTPLISRVAALKASSPLQQLTPQTIHDTQRIREESFFVFESLRQNAEAWRRANSANLVGLTPKSSHPLNAELNVSARAISPSTAWTLRGFAIAFARLRTSAQHRHAIAGNSNITIEPPRPAAPVNQNHPSLPPGGRRRLFLGA